MSDNGTRIGELAARTGLTVRTLRHYDQIGLLRPTIRSGGGHRYYSADDIARLQQIVALRGLGLPLEEIREILDRRSISPVEAVELQIERMRERLAEQQSLLRRLEDVAARLRTSRSVTIADLTTTVEATTIMEKYYSSEQQEEIRRRADELGPEGLRDAERQWSELMEEVRQEMAAGTDPTSERVRALAARWQELVRGFTGGNPGIAQGAQKMWESEETIQGIDTSEVRAMWSYLHGAA